MINVLFVFLIAVSSIFAGSVERSVGTGSVSRTLGAGSVVRSVAGTPTEPPAVCDGEFLTDTFTEGSTGNISLYLHTPETLQRWTGTHAEDGSIVLDRANDDIKSTDALGNTKYAYIDTTAECANYTVSGIAKTGTTGSSNRVGVLGRWVETLGGNGYRLRIQGDAVVRLEKVVNGTAFDLDVDSIAGFSGSTYYTLDLKMNGSTIEGYIDGVLKCSATDSDHTSAGVPGVMLRNTSVRLTSISATYL